MSAQPAQLTCLTCGLDGVAGKDVVFTVVELQPEDQRKVTMTVPANHRIGSVMVPIEVTERYAAQPRCKDRKACEERLATYQLAQLAAPPEQPIEEEYEL